MSYITYSPTSLESFLIRGTIYNNNVYYTKLKLKPGSFSDTKYFQFFDDVTWRANRRINDNKTPLIMTFETVKPEGTLSGEYGQFVLELWLNNMHIPEHNNNNNNNNNERSGFLKYNPIELLGIMQNYELENGLFSKKTTFINQ